MSTVAVAKRYSQAMFALSIEQNNLKKVLQDLNEVYNLVEEHQELKKALNNKLMPAELKEKIFRELFADEITPVSLNFLSLIFRKKREYILKEIVEQFTELANESAGIVKAKVKSAVELSPKETEELQQALNKATKKQVEIQLEIDEKVIAGLIVRIGDRIIDGSVATKLKLLEKHLNSVDLYKNRGEKN